MAISKDLFLSILSMDSYNRGYGAGINFGVNSDALNTKIGEAKITKSKGDAEARSVGFYGIAYDTGSVSNFSEGEKTIAYRGTDETVSWSNLGTSLDIWNGYGVGTGSAEGKQAELAIKFYQDVAGANWQGANVSLTGHSLGGGLAGLVGRRISRRCNRHRRNGGLRGANPPYFLSACCKCAIASSGFTHANSGN